MLTIFASDVFHVGAHGFGFLQSSRGLGAVIGSSLFIGMGQQPAQGKILTHRGDSLRRRFCGFRGCPVVCIGDHPPRHGRRHRRNLVGGARYDSSINNTGEISRPNHGSSFN